MIFEIIEATEVQTVCHYGSEPHGLSIYDDAYVIDCGACPQTLQLDLVGLNRVVETIRWLPRGHQRSSPAPRCHTRSGLVLDRFEFAEVAHVQVL